MLYCSNSQSIPFNIFVYHLRSSTASSTSSSTFPIQLRRWSCVFLPPLSHPIWERIFHLPLLHSPQCETCPGETLPMQWNIPTTMTCIPLIGNLLMNCWITSVNRCSHYRHAFWHIISLITPPYKFYPVQQHMRSRRGYHPRCLREGCRNQFSLEGKRTCALNLS